MSSWRDKITFLTPTYEEHEVNGKMLKFYPISYKKMAQLKRIGRPLALAVTQLLRDPSKEINDNASTVRYFPQLAGEIAQGSETITEPTSVEILKFRAIQKEQAMAQLVDAFTDDANIMVFGDIVMDSLRDVFPRDYKPDDITAFVFGSEDHPALDPDTMWQLGHGCLKATKGLFGPLARKLQGFTKELEQKMTKGLSTISTKLSEKSDVPSEANDLLDQMAPEEREQILKMAEKAEKEPADGTNSSSSIPTTPIGTISKTPSSGSSPSESDPSTT